MSQRKLKSRTDRKHWLDCLDDPTLLERAILDGNSWLVPVGGERRGGYTALSAAKHARELMARMAEHGGFPNARYVSGGRNYLPHVHWGWTPTASTPNATTVIQKENTPASSAR
jgi:hypothetical protein